MRGDATEEIAAKVGRAPRIVERKLDLIRQRRIAWRIPLRSRTQEP
jgi:hypothetical protein